MNVLPVPQKVPTILLYVCYILKKNKKLGTNEANIHVQSKKR